MTTNIEPYAGSVADLLEKAAPGTDFDQIVEIADQQRMSTGNEVMMPKAFALWQL